MKIQVEFSHRITTTGDDARAYVSWDENIRDVPRGEKKGWYWKTDVARHTVEGNGMGTIVACVEVIALGMFKDPSIEAVAADGSVVIGHTTVRMQTHIERDKIKEK
jgi:hypothetical protein